ncbi:MAG: hypothetical protein Q8P30_02295 [Candidatus Uhrbacteria bacterium]|nr:hypothetical protein [Candidatus Uhrbacteria bacterium]
MPQANNQKKGMFEPSAVKQEPLKHEALHFLAAAVAVAFVTLACAVVYLVIKDAFFPPEIELSLVQQFEQESGLDEIVTQVTVEDERVFDERTLNFEYPEGVRVSIERSIGGMLSSGTVRFWTENEDGILEYTGLSLVYLEALEYGEDGGATFEEARIHWDTVPVELIEYTIDDRDAFRVNTLDMSGDTFTLYIPAEDEGYSYQFHGSFLNKDVVEEILDMFADTAELKS